MDTDNIILEQIVVGPLAVNCYLVGDRGLGKIAIIDPGCEGKTIRAAIERLRVEPVCIVLTHGHIDHIGANRELHEKYDIPIFIHQEDAPLLTVEQDRELQILIGGSPSPPADDFIAEGESMRIGDVELSFIHTPGHTPGSVSIKCAQGIITGDTLFNMGVGRTDLPGGSMSTLIKSITEKLYREDPDTVIYPGHGPGSTIGDEMKFNPFVRYGETSGTF